VFWQKLWSSSFAFIFQWALRFSIGNNSWLSLCFDYLLCLRLSSLINFNPPVPRDPENWIFFPRDCSLSVLSIRISKEIMKEMSTRLIREFIPILVCVNVGNDSYGSFRQWK
jgi:hypothetical protein